MAIEVRRPGVYTTIVYANSEVTPQEPDYGTMVVGPVYDIVSVGTGATPNSGASLQSAAKVAITGAVSYAVGAKTLVYRFNGGVEQTFTFPGSDGAALTHANVLAALADATGLRAATTGTGDNPDWELQTLTTGLGATLWFSADSTATDALGIVTATSFIGANALGVGNRQISFDELPVNKVASASDRVLDPDTLRVFLSSGGTLTELGQTTGVAASCAQFLYPDYVDGVAQAAAPYCQAAVPFVGYPEAGGGDSTTLVTTDEIQRYHDFFSGAIRIKTKTLTGTTGTNIAWDGTAEAVAITWADPLCTIEYDAETSTYAAIAAAIAVEDDLSDLIELELLTAAGTDAVPASAGANFNQAVTFLNQGRARIDPALMTAAAETPYNKGAGILTRLDSASVAANGDLTLPATCVLNVAYGHALTDAAQITIAYAAGDVVVTCTYAGTVYTSTVASADTLSAEALADALEDLLSVAGADDGLIPGFDIDVSHTAAGRILFQEGGAALGMESYIRLSGNFATTFIDGVSGTTGYIESFGVPLFLGTVAADNLMAGYSLIGTGKIVSKAITVGTTPVLKLTESGSISGTYSPSYIKATGLTESTAIKPGLNVSSGGEYLIARTRLPGRTHIGYADFSALRTDLYVASTPYTGRTSLEEAFGDLDPTANPTVFATMLALEETGGEPVRLAGVPTDDAAGYTETIKRRERDSWFYLNLTSGDHAIIEDAIELLTTWAERGNYKRLITGVDPPTEKAPTSVIGGAVQSYPDDENIEIVVDGSTLLDAFVEAGYPTADLDALNTTAFYVKVVGQARPFKIKEFVSATMVKIQLDSWSTAEDLEDFWFGTAATGETALPTINGSTATVYRRVGALADGSTVTQYIAAYSALREQLECPYLELVPSRPYLDFDETEIQLTRSQAAAALCGWKTIRQPSESYSSTEFPIFTDVENAFGTTYMDEASWDQLSGFVWLVRDTPVSNVMVRGEISTYVRAEATATTEDQIKQAPASLDGLAALGLLMASQARPLVGKRVTASWLAGGRMVVHSVLGRACGESSELKLADTGRLLSLSQTDTNRRQVVIEALVRPVFIAEDILFRIVAS